MPKGKAVRRSSRKRQPKAARKQLKQPPSDLASRIRGIYRRVASKLGLDPSYVSRVARGERSSPSVEAELRRELNRIVESFGKRKR